LLSQSSKLTGKKMVGQRLRRRKHFRQTKAGRRGAGSERRRMRAALRQRRSLAPLAWRAGIESERLFGLSPLAAPELGKHAHVVKTTDAGADP
jgi:hypothetical protein